MGDGVHKTRLKKSQPELTTRCSQLKMAVADGKCYLTDCYSSKDFFFPFKLGVFLVEYFSIRFGRDVLACLFELSEGLYGL